MTVLQFLRNFSWFFRDILERNNDYSDTLDFRRGRVGEVRVIRFFWDCKSAMLIYLCSYKSPYRSQFRTDFQEIHMVGAGPHIGEPYCFWEQSASTTTDMGENVLSKPVFWISFSWYGIFWGKIFKTVFGIPFSIEKFIIIFVIQCPIPPFPEKWSCPQKLFFAVILEILFFFFFFLKKSLTDKSSKPHFL